MDDSFEERRKKNEDKWALDQKLRFQAVARRAKLLGQWAAGELGLAAGEVDVYAREVVAAEVRPGGALGKVTADLAAKGVGPGEEAIRRHSEALFRLAQDQVKSGQ